MPVYQYTGQLPEGTAITGTFEADTIESARQRLTDVAVHVSSLSETPKISSRRPLSRDDFLFFNQQVASLAKNGIALDKGLRAFAADLERGPLKQAVTAVADDLESGTPLHEAVQKQEGQFPPFYANVLKAGAEHNDLGETLLNFNNHLTLLGTAKHVFWEAVTYPIIVLVFLGLLVSFFMLVVVPGYAEAVLGVSEGASDVTYGFDVALPPMTHWFVVLSRSWLTIMTIGLVLLIALVSFIWFLCRSKAGLQMKDSLIRFIPGLAGAYRASLIARFTNSVALGARAGQPLPAVIRAAAGATGSSWLSSEAEKLASSVEMGNMPESAISFGGLIPSLVTYTMQVDYGRGQLAEALAELSHYYDIVARQKLTTLRMIFTPLALIFVALFVGAAVIALLSPLFSLINSLTGG